MKLYTCTDHDCHYNVGVASIVVAEDAQSAIRLLNDELEKQGLDPTIVYSFLEIDMEKPQAIILQNGGY